MALSPLTGPPTLHAPTINQLWKRHTYRNGPRSLMSFFSSLPARGSVCRPYSYR
ncbi:hypothetical protein CGRA01v4_10499 [Colletotrichum graminicola]|nr:hypothetical protein CGRA01v4_10499 [Colletotrichum graminicola]